MRPYAALPILAMLSACGPTLVNQKPCLLPTDQVAKEEVAPLPVQDTDLIAALKLWRQEHGEHVKLAERKNDVVNFVQEHCQ